MASSNSRAVNNEILSPITMIDWIKMEIDELKKNEYTALEADAFERQILIIAQFMQKKYDDLEKADDVPLLHHSHLQSISAEPNLSTRTDFMLIGYYVKKLLLKVVNWKKGHQDEAKKKGPRTNSQQREKLKKPFLLNPALLQNTNEIRMGKRSPTIPIVDLDFDDLEEEEDGIFLSENGNQFASTYQCSSSSIPANSKRQKNQQNIFSTKMFNKNDKTVQREGNAMQIVPNQQPKSTSKTCPKEPKEPNLGVIKKEIIVEDEESTTKQNNTKKKIEDPYLRDSLQEEALENLFSKDSSEDDENATRGNGEVLGLEAAKQIEEEQSQIVSVKEEVTSENEEETTNADEYESDEEEEEEENGMEGIEDESNNSEKEGGVDENENDAGGTPSPNSVVTLLPEDIQMQAQQNKLHASDLTFDGNRPNSTEKVRQLPVQQSANSLEKIHADINIQMEIGQITKQRKRKFIEEPTNASENVSGQLGLKLSPNYDYSEFSQRPTSSFGVHPWHKNAPTQKNLSSSATSSSLSTSGNGGQTTNSSVNANCSIKYSDRIKKKLRVDYENEQKAKNKQWRKNLKVHFSKNKPTQRIFEIEEEGNALIKRCRDSNNYFHCPTTKRFLNGDLGQIRQLPASNSRYLSAQIQNDLKLIVETVNDRDDKVIEQITRIEKGEESGEILMRLTRFMIADSMLANLDEKAFRNMKIFKLDKQRNIKMLINVLGQQLEFFKNKKNLPAMGFSYIFICHGFDDIADGEFPSTEKLIELRRWFVENLESEELPREFGTYRYSVPQFVLITIPKIGDMANKIRAYNNELRKFVRSNTGDFILLDWANRIDGMHGDLTYESMVQCLVEMLKEFAVMIK